MDLRADRNAQGGRSLSQVTKESRVSDGIRPPDSSVRIEQPPATRLVGGPNPPRGTSSVVTRLWLDRNVRPNRPRRTGRGYRAFSIESTQRSNAFGGTSSCRSAYPRGASGAPNKEETGHSSVSSGFFPRPVPVRALALGTDARLLVGFWRLLAVSHLVEPARHPLVLAALAPEAPQRDLHQAHEGNRTPSVAS